MTSILTNNASMVALQSLNATQMALNNTENQISTGLKVGTAKDNAAVWAVASTMRSDVNNLGQVGTNLGTANGIVGTALAGATLISSLVGQIRMKVTAEADGTGGQSATDDQSDITSLVNQISQIVAGSSYDGVNMLNGSSSMNFASTIVVNSAGLSQVSTISVSAFSNASAEASSGATASAITNLATTGGLAGLATLETATISSSNLQSFLQVVDSAANAVNAVAASLGSAQSNIQNQQSFVAKLADTLSTGVGNLVDADMTAESARLSALQTQQSLGTQALSIANQAPQAILRLFQ